MYINHYQLTPLMGETVSEIALRKSKTMRKEFTQERLLSIVDKIIVDMTLSRAPRFKFITHFLCLGFVMDVFDNCVSLKRQQTAPAIS